MPSETREPFARRHERADIPCVCSQCAPYNDRAKPERHEFHMANEHIAFCICGWVDDLYDYARPVQVDYLGERYREHLDRSS